MKKVLLSFVLASISQLVFAGGFQIDQQGHKATALGGAFTGLCSDASAIFYDPAGLSNLTGHNFTFGLTLIDPAVSLQTDAYDNIDQTTKQYTPFQFYYSGQINDKINIGLGVNNQFGSSSSFDDDWQGKFIIQNISLQTYMFQPTASYKILDKLSIGAGFVFSTASFKLQKAIPVSSQNYNYGEANLKGNATSAGYNVGLFSNLFKKKMGNLTYAVSVGADYRSSLALNLKKGNAQFSDIPTSLQTEFPGKVSFTSKIVLPAVATGGIAINIAHEKNYNIRLLYDFEYTFWSSYDTLKFNFTNDTTPNVTSPKCWKNAPTHRIGISFTYKQKYTLRGGFFDDITPVPDGFVSPELPDQNSTGFTAGLGIKIGDNLSIDLSYLRTKFERLDASLNSEGFKASYRRIVNLYGIGINLRFGKPKGGKQTGQKSSVN